MFNRIITLRLSGGLGNQLFQYGAALDLVNYDISQIKIYTEGLAKYEENRNFELNKIIRLNNVNLISEKNYLVDCRLPKIISLNNKHINLISDRNYKKIKKNSTISIMDGYFQESISQETFDREIKFFQKNLINHQKEYFQNKCVIHIRGNDFLKLNWSSNDLFYYKKAINQVYHKLGINDFFVITDDRKYSNFLLRKLKVSYQFINTTGHIEDFHKIGAFQYRILSSSTFCLWASALGNNSGSMVFAPSFWRPGVIRQISIPNETKL